MFAHQDETVERLSGRLWDVSIRNRIVVTLVVVGLSAQLAAVVLAVTEGHWIAAPLVAGIWVVVWFGPSVLGRLSRQRGDQRPDDEPT